IADGETDKAIHTLQTGMALARHTSDAPTIINGLIAAAMVSSFAPQIEKLTKRPGSPNLYWALTNFPRPLIDFRKPLQGERIMVDNIFPGVREAMAQAKGSPL